MFIEGAERWQMHSVNLNGVQFSRSLRVNFLAHEAARRRGVAYSAKVGDIRVVTFSL